MTAVAAQEILAAWDRLCLLPRTAHWDARNSALLEALGVAAERDTPGARQEILLNFYAEKFDQRLDGVATCPECATEVELSVPVAELMSGMPSPEPVEPVDLEGMRVRWRLPGAADLAASARCPDPEQGALLLLQRISGVEKLAEPVRAELAQRVAASDPFADITFDLTCPECGAGWESPLDAGAFVWARLRSAARRLLGEVDELARAYGWSEEQILSLPPQRRASYLELVRHG